VATYFFKVGRETPARASSGWALTHSWSISKRKQHKSGLEREISSEKGNELRVVMGGGGTEMGDDVETRT